MVEATSTRSGRVIEIEQMTKTYEIGDIKVPALRGVSFSIAAGEYVAIMGPSGSGKSTLMNLIGCLDKPTTGLYRLDSVDVSALDDADLAKIRLQKLGFIFQGFNLLARTSAVRNVALPLFYAGDPQREAKATEVLKLVGLGDRLEHKPQELSGGQQQRVAIARALVNNPAVLLADEPTGNLDTANGQHVLELLIRLNKEEGATLVLVTHDEMLASHAERRIILKDGKIVGGTGPHSPPELGGDALA